MDYNMIVMNENDRKKVSCSRNILEAVIFSININYFIHCIAMNIIIRSH